MDSYEAGIAYEAERDELVQAAEAQVPADWPPIIRGTMLPLLSARLAAHSHPAVLHNPQHRVLRSATPPPLGSSSGNTRPGH